MNSEPKSLSEAFASFVPIDRRFSLAYGESLPEFAYGSALIGDLTGFTAAVAELRSVHGQKRAAEEITEALNSVFSPLIEITHEFGGAVIGFAGDAITCWFEDDDGARAVAAALRMREAVSHLKGFQLAEGRRKFGIKIAVETGDARRYLVGDPAIQTIEVLAGAIMDRLDDFLKLCSAGDVILSEDVEEALGDLLVPGEVRELDGERLVLCEKLTEEPPTQAWPPQPPVQAARFRPWVSPSIADRLEAGGDALLAEVRPVVAMFVQLEDTFGEGDFSEAAALNEYIAFVQRIVSELEGDLITLTVGDKGNSLYIVFGATTAHEDDEQRAVRAAIRLNSPPQDIELGRNARFGISSGEMRVGTYGNPERRAFDVQGLEVNLANRLMSKAGPGEIFISDRVARKIDRSAQTEPVGELMLKGIASPMLAHRVLHERDRMLEIVPNNSLGKIIGRDAEMARLSDALTNAKEGTSGLALIEGPAGIGKSRVLAELRRLADDAGVGTWFSSIDEIDQRRPCYIWTQIARTAFGIEQGDTGEAIRDAIAQHLPEGEDGQDLLPLLNPIFPMQLPETEATEKLLGRQRADTMVKILLTALDHARNGAPLLLILEDAHWMDALSMAVITASRKMLGRTLIAISTRGPAKRSEVGMIIRKHKGVHVTLDSLDEDGTRAMIASRLGVDELPDELAHHIHNRSSGQPFFAEELAFALREAGRIRVADGKCVVTAAQGLDQLEFPSTLQGIITSRLDKMAQSQQLVLKVGSVIGRTFGFAMVKKVYPYGGDAEWLKTDLDALSRQGITNLVQSEPTSVYMFRHALLRDVVYQRLLSVQRRELHRAVATSLELEYADDLSPYYAVLAHHWEEVANEAEPDPKAKAKAIDYHRKAGSAAMRNGLVKDALAFGLYAVRLMNVNVPAELDTIAESISQTEADIAHKMADRGAESLLDLPAMVNKEPEQIVETLLELMPAAYMAGRPEIFSLAAALNLKTTLDHGNAPITPIVHSMYAIQRRTGSHDIDGAFEFSTLSMALDEKLGGNHYPTCSYIHTRFISIWKRPLRDTFAINRKGAEVALDTGNVLYGCWHRSLLVQHASAAGMPLAELKSLAIEQRDAIGKQVLSSRFHCILDLQYAKALMGETESQFSLTDVEHDEDESLRSILDTDLDNQMLYYHVTRLKLFTYYGDYARAIREGEKGFEILQASAGQVAEVELRFYFAVAALGGSHSAKDKLFSRALDQAHHFNNWRGHCEENFGHMANLLKGLLAAKNGDGQITEDGLTAAAASAAENGFTQYEALAYEWLGNHHKAQADPTKAAAAFEAAKEAYRRWGAILKVREIDAEIAKGA